ncbi:hypothetical protein C0Q70_19694 [Pomacea canaliculata]|uniref:OAR domain-containing protein n=1 Tax=Pomacea canaliculata TaxID=400727 RepID=A0A2T7NDG2_POMCA|nr:hypothetical protein C0Q70_19694 [Pomacea canaliculata]
MAPGANGCKVWFQNRRAKWKKRKKATNVFRSPGALLPSTGLSPFMGSMGVGDTFCAFPPSPADPSRWPGMTQIASQMNHGNVNPLTLAGSLPRQNLSQSLTAQGMAGMTSLAGAGNSGMTFGNGLGGLGGINVNSLNTAPAHASPPATYTSVTYHNTMTASCSSPLGGSSPSPTLPVSAAAGSLQCSGLGPDMEDAWRGSSIAALRRKAMEHSVNLSGYR